MKNSKRVFIALFLVAAAGFAGFRVWQAYEKKTQAASQKPGRAATRVVTVSVTRATTGAVRDEIEITGSLKPKEQVDVTAQVTGRVRTLTPQIGDLVKRGTLIAELEDAELEQQVRRAQAAQAMVAATIEQRRAEISSAKADLDRAKQLLDAGLIARQDFDIKQTNFRVIQSQVTLAEAQQEQARAELTELKIRLEQMRILAPMTGYIAQKFVDAGAVVGPSNPIVRLVNLSTLVTVANVPERSVAKLRVGNRAVVRVDAFGDRVFDGRVARVNPVLDAATRTALVEVEIPNPGGMLKAEMFARVQLDLGTTREAVLIPREALVYRGQQAGVFVLESNRPAFTPIDTGKTEGGQVEVLNRLYAGTVIVSRGAAMLNDGDEVNVVNDGEQLETENLRRKPGARLKAAINPALVSLAP